VNNNGKLSKKSYVYNIHEDLFDSLKHEEVLWKFVDYDSYGAERFKIITDREYSNPVIIIDAKEGLTPDRPEIVEYSVGVYPTVYDMPDVDEVPWKEQMSKEFLGGMTPYKMVEEHKEYEKMATTSSIVTTLNAGTAEASASAILDNTKFAYVDYKDVCGYTNIASTPGNCEDYTFTWNSADSNKIYANGCDEVITASTLEEKIIQCLENKRKDEKDMMNKKIFSFDFGKETGVKMSIYGPAFRSYEKDRDSSFFAYDKKKMTDIKDTVAAMINAELYPPRCSAT
jgi:hypothetical protein